MMIPFQTINGDGADEALAGMPDPFMYLEPGHLPVYGALTVVLLALVILTRVLLNHRERPDDNNVRPPKSTPTPHRETPRP